MKKTVKTPKVIHVCDLCKTKRTQENKCKICGNDLCSSCALNFQDARICHTHIPQIGLKRSWLQDIWRNKYYCDSGFELLTHANFDSWIVIITMEDSVHVDVCESKAVAEDNIKTFYEQEPQINDYVNVVHHGKFYDHEMNIQIIIPSHPKIPYTAPSP